MVIVVIGSAYLRGSGASGVPDGLAGRVAVAAAAEGVAVELIAKVGADAVGDALLLAFTAAGVGHVAVLRDSVHPTAHRVDPPDESTIDALTDLDPEAAIPDLSGWTVPPSAAPSLEPADVELALRYLTDYRVLAVVQPDPSLLAPIIAAADWSGAHLVIVSDATSAPPSLPDDAVVLSLATEPVEGSAFGSRLGAYTAAVDRGTPPSEAFATLTLAEA
jgi:sugar/nucleoside kinase (ribokinase family)